jgi:hypothetical protein
MPHRHPALENKVLEEKQPSGGCGIEPGLSGQAMKKTLGRDESWTANFLTLIFHKQLRFSS